MLKLFFLVLSLWAGGRAEAPKAARLAVLSIQNTTRTEASFVEALPDMVVRELVRVSPDLQLVERSQVEAAMDELQLDIGGLTEEGSRRVGQWVGAERILVGTLSSLGTTARLDLRIIEVQSGRILLAGHATARMQDLGQLVPLAVEVLIGNGVQSTPKALKPPEPVAGPVQVSKVAVEVREIAYLRIRYRAVLSLFTQKAVPLQRVRVYGNGKLLGESPVLDAVNEDFYVYAGDVAAGPLELRLEHGVLDKGGHWKGIWEVQPEACYMELSAGERRELDYKLKVGSAGFKFTRL